MKKRWLVTWRGSQENWLRGASSHRFRWQARRVSNELHDKGFVVQRRRAR